LFVVLAAVGGNLPDLDLLYSYVSSDRKLDYLLEHRGYTHSIVGCVRRCSHNVPWIPPRADLLQ